MAPASGVQTSGALGPRPAPLLVRQAVAADRDALIAMGLRFWASGPYVDVVEGLEAADVARLIDLVFASGFVVVLATASQEIVGALAVALIRSPATLKVEGSELAFWVEPAYRGGSGARRLLQTAEAWAQARGVVNLKLSAPVGSRAGRLFERAGYRAVETLYQRTL